MTDIDEPVLGAHALREAGRSLATSSGRIDDSASAYAVLGYTASALASLTQTLHQLGAFHDRLARTDPAPAHDPHTLRIAANKISWELHRAAEVIRQVARGIERAHEIEATIDDSRSELAGPLPSNSIPGLSR